MFVRTGAFVDILARYGYGRTMRRVYLAFAVVAASLPAPCAGPQPTPETAARPVPVPPAATATIALPEPQALLVGRLARLAPDADRGVIALAVQARACALRHGDADANARLAVIDYSKPSTQKRLWVFDVATDQLLFREHVSHGQGSGDNVARRFSNVEGSYATSLGLYRTAETYIGGNGYSLRMDGLDPGFNDNARQRAIVMHGAWYANPDRIRTQGRLGRSQGCPALREGIARVVIDTLKQRQLLFAYADDAQFLQRGRSFACDGRDARGILAAARGEAMHGGAAMSAIAAP
jgi:hypothetical protein